MIFIGIDPGLDGGIAKIHTTPAFALELIKTPVIDGRDYDVQGMKEILKESIHMLLFVTIENQISMPGQGLTSTLQTGKGFGIWLGLLAGLEIPFQVVSAKQWQHKLYTGVSAKLSTKGKSEVVAKRLFPAADFRRSERARVASDGLTDAACIAEYGKRTYQQQHIDVSNVKPHVPMPHNEEVCLMCGVLIESDLYGCQEKTT